MKDGIYRGPNRQKVKIFTKDVGWCDYIQYIQYGKELPKILDQYHKYLLKGFKLSKTKSKK